MYDSNYKISGYQATRTSALHRVSFEGLLSQENGGLGRLDVWHDKVFNNKEIKAKIINLARAAFEEGKWRLAKHKDSSFSEEFPISSYEAQDYFKKTLQSESKKENWFGKFSETSRVELLDAIESYVWHAAYQAAELALPEWGEMRMEERAKRKRDNINNPKVFNEIRREDAFRSASLNDARALQDYLTN